MRYTHVYTYVQQYTKVQAYICYIQMWDTYAASSGKIIPLPLLVCLEKSFENASLSYKNCPKCSFVQNQWPDLMIFVSCMYR